MIKNVKTLYHSPNGTQEPLELTLKGFSLQSEPEFHKDIYIKGRLLRIEEGVMVLLDELEALQEGHCVRCGKKIEQKLSFEPSEWLYFEKEPERYDDENEFLFIDLEKYIIDLSDPIRQELLLHRNEVMHCPQTCREFKEQEKGVKALSQLKDLQFESGQVK